MGILIYLNILNQDSGVVIDIEIPVMVPTIAWMRNGWDLYVAINPDDQFIFRTAFHEKPNEVAIVMLSFI